MPAYVAKNVDTARLETCATSRLMTHRIPAKVESTQRGAGKL